MLPQCHNDEFITELKLNESRLHSSSSLSRALIKGLGGLIPSEQKRVPRPEAVIKKFMRAK